MPIDPRTQPSSVGGDHAPSPLRARAGVRGLAASRIREVANAGLGQEGVLRFWFGESDMPTPEPIIAAAISALGQGRTFYAHNLGIPDLREAIAGYMEDCINEALIATLSRSPAQAFRP